MNVEMDAIRILTSSFEILCSIFIIPFSGSGLSRLGICFSSEKWLALKGRDNFRIFLKQIIIAPLQGLI